MRREADQIVVAYPLTQTVRVELEALAAAERRCCAFAKWDVVQDGDQVLLHITATPDGLCDRRSDRGITSSERQLKHRGLASLSVVAGGSASLAATAVSQ